MAKKEKVLFTTMAFVTAMLLMGCPGPDTCLEDSPRYDFDVSASFTPNADSVRVGDTIFYQSEAPSTLTPRGGTAPVKYTEANLRGVIYILEYPYGQQRRYGAKDFRFIQIKGESSGNIDKFQEYRYGESGGRYELRMAIVPQRKGRYVFAVTHSSDVNHCDGAYFNINLTNDQQKNKAMTETWAGGPGFIHDQVYAVIVY